MALFKLVAVHVILRSFIELSTSSSNHMKLTRQVIFRRGVLPFEQRKKLLEKARARARRNRTTFTSCIVRGVQVMYARSEADQSKWT